MANGTWLAVSTLLACSGRSPIQSGIASEIPISSPPIDAKSRCAARTFFASIRGEKETKIHAPHAERQSFRNFRVTQIPSPMRLDQTQIVRPGPFFARELDRSTSSVHFFSHFSEKHLSKPSMASFMWLGSFPSAIRCLKNKRTASAAVFTSSASTSKGASSCCAGSRSLAHSFAKLRMTESNSATKQLNSSTASLETVTFSSM